MGKYRFKIDEKSLWYGLYNDLKGQSATVATPLNQSKDPNKWHKDILVLETLGISKEINNPVLLKKCIKKTTSQADAVVDSFFEFDNLFVDGKKLNCGCSFGMYIKRETSETIKHRHGNGYGPNTHLGRKQLHYQVSLKHLTDGFNIDNKKVLDSILQQNGGFAYVVRGFEYDSGDKSLNFITSMIGVQNTRLSAVFLRKKGVGKKLIVKEIDPDLVQDDYPPELVALMETLQVNEKKENLTQFDVLNKTRVENGKLGEEIIIKYLMENFEDISDLYHTSKDYPTSPYDIEYTDKDGTKKYVEVKSTSGTRKCFNMSSGEIKFMNSYKDNYILFLVSDCKNQFPTINKFEPSAILKLRKEYPSTRFIA